MPLVKSVLFIDGENLTMRYQALLETGRLPHEEVIYIPDIFVWNRTFANGSGIQGITTDLLRINYYTSVVGDDDKLNEIRQMIAKECYRHHGDVYGTCQLNPRVYKRERRGLKTRLVDINMVIDVMRSSYTADVDVVYLFSGDGDFLHLIEDVVRRGRKVCVGAFSSGLHPALAYTADRFINLDPLFFKPSEVQNAPP
jgi:uncharacterized LabA/DUF88 family protein